MSPARKILATLVALGCLTLAAGYGVVRQSYIADPLLPAEKSAYPWRAFTSADAAPGKPSTIDLRDSTYNLSFDFTLSSIPEYPFVTLGLTFDDETHPERLLDWSRYAEVVLKVKCRPDNVLSFVLHSYDEQITRFADMGTFRPSIAFFPCSGDWRPVRINLHRLDTPEWWLRQHNLTLANGEYQLTAVRGFSLATSPQSAPDIPSSVSVAEITLVGRDWTFIVGAVLAVVLVWAGALYWCIPPLLRMNREGRAAMVVPVSYQPLDLDSRQERHKSALLDYLASHYMNPELDVDTLVGALGINRAKINDILRETTGLTFSSYINKLRLTEAARLLSEKQMAVSEAAFAVGYCSLSYFNRVFKKEFGCTPSTYKAPADTAANTDPHDLNNPHK